MTTGAFFDQPSHHQWQCTVSLLAGYRRHSERPGSTRLLSTAAALNSDHQVRQVVDRFSTLSLGEQAQFLDGLADDRRPLFGIFGQRSATLSVREQDPAWLSAGLTGAVIANYHIPNGRPVEPALAVFYHCATELGLDPAVLFAVAARMASEDMALRLTDFGRKPEITLRHYGWKVVKTPDGVVFRNEWR